MINVQNSNLKDYYYNVVLQLNNIGLGDMSTTEDFYYNTQHCYERGLDINECVDELIELQGEKR